MARNRKLYSYAAVMDAAERLAASGYEMDAIEGAILDDLIFLPPDKNKVFFVAEVVPLNAWESAYYWHRYNELPARWQTALEEEHARLDADA